jgi:hypothetical protein
MPGKHSKPKKKGKAKGKPSGAPQALKSSYRKVGY